MKIALGAAVLVAGPWILYQIWKFVSPGLHAQERRFVYFLIPFSTLLGFLGLVLMYYIMLPIILNFMVTMAGNVEMNDTSIAVSESMSSIVFPIVETNPEAAAAGDTWIKMPEGVLTVAVPSNDVDVLKTLNIPMNHGSLISQQFQLSSYLSFVIMLMFAIAVAFQLPMAMLLLGWLGVVTPQWLRAHRKHALFVLAIVSALITPQDVISMVMMLIPLYLLYELGIALIVFVPVSRVAGKHDDT